MDRGIRVFFAVNSTPGALPEPRERREPMPEMSSAGGALPPRQISAEPSQLAQRTRSQPTNPETTDTRPPRNMQAPETGKGTVVDTMG